LFHVYEIFLIMDSKFISFHQVGHLSDFANVELVCAIDILQKLQTPKNQKAFIGIHLNNKNHYDDWLTKFPDQFRLRIERATHPDVIFKPERLKEELTNLMNEPMHFIRAASGYDFFGVPNGVSKEKKSHGQVSAEGAANKEHHIMYLCLYVILLSQTANANALFAQYYISFDDFKQYYERASICVRRKRNDKYESANGNGRSVRKPTKTTLMVDIPLSSALTDTEWHALFYCRNVMVLCYIVSPRLKQKGNVVSAASILALRYRITAGGGAGTFSCAVNRVFEGVTDRCFPGNGTPTEQQSSLTPAAGENRKRTHQMVAAYDDTTASTVHEIAPDGIVLEGP
jgi:hypothetical protein